MPANPGPQQDFLEITRWASRSPDAPALLSPGREPLTYARLWDHVAATSEELERAGLRKGAVAAVALPSDPVFATTVLAVILRSACAPLDPGLTRDEYQAYLQRLGASLLIVPEGTSPAAEAASQLGITVIHVRGSEGAPAGVFSLRAVERPGAPLFARQTDAAFVLLTSSTTGVPKLVPWSRANVRAAVAQDIRAFDLTAADRFLSMMPLHASHSMYALLTQLGCGGSAGCPASLDASGILAALGDVRPTWLSCGPALHQMLLLHARENPGLFHQIPLRFVRSAGAPPELGLLETLEKLLGVPVLDSYGLTEIPGVARNTPSARRPGSLGRSVGAELAILDDSANRLPPGQTGEIAARGPTLMQGYLDDPEANRAAFDNGWFRTGDMGTIDNDGFLFLAGRKKEMINRGGTKISPREVDDVLARHPDVVDVAAFAIPHRTLGEDVAAAVVFRSSATMSELDLRGFAAAHLAAYKVPRRIVFLDSIPRGAVGRPKRSALSEQYGKLLEARTAGPSGRREDPRPPTGTEARLIGVWKRILGVDPIGVEDDFFDLGGDSLSASLMLAQAQALSDPGGGKLETSDFFDRPTVATLARALENSGRAVDSRGPDRLLLLNREGARRPFFCFANSVSMPDGFRHLGRELGPQQPFAVIFPPDQRDRLLTAEVIARQSLDVICSVQKEGPYTIGGYCYGGVLAFEAARQLAERGEQVAFLALLDTPAPGYPRIARQWKRYARKGAEALSGFVHGKPVISAADMAAHLRVVGRVVARRLGARVKGAMGLAGREAYWIGEEWNAVVMRGYILRSFPSRIVQFLAADPPVSTAVLDDPRLGWRDVAQGGFEARQVPGDHVTMLNEANTLRLAGELERVLQDAANLGQGSHLSRFANA